MLFIVFMNYQIFISNREETEEKKKIRYYIFK